MSDYSSIDEVSPYVAYLLQGETSLNSTTAPTGTQATKVIDRLCGVLNLALQKEGIAVPITNSTAKLACDDWVTRYAVMNVKAMAPGNAYDDENSDTMYSYKGLMKSAAQFAKDNRLGFIDLGISQTRKASDGLAFTGMDAQDERSDPDDDSLMQPMFTRGQFNDPEISSFSDDNEDYE